MRIIVKNLPKFITKEQIEKEFSEYGKIVDICLLKDSKGNFRRVCYIGYISNEVRDLVIKKMNNSYIYNHKIQVEEASFIKREVTESEERIVRYHNKIVIKNCNLDDIPELQKYGEILKYEYTDRLIIQYRNVEDTLKVLKNLNIVNGKLVKVSPFKNLVQPNVYYNSLFFNFESVIKRTCEIEKIKKNELVDLEDKDLATKIALLETNLVSETDKFLKRNNIDLNCITGKNKKVLIVRNLEINKVLDFVNCKCKMEASPSRNLVLLKFKSEEEAYKCFKSINLRRYNDNVIYCEYAPLSQNENIKDNDKDNIKDNENIKDKDNIKDSDKDNIKDNDKDNIKDNDKDNIKDSENIKDKDNIKDNVTKVKMLIKNVPFQATQKDIANLFKKKFKVQGIRLPIKRDGTLRGFAFVTFDSKKTLEDAIEYFGKSTHLYGRRLVLEVAKE